jgi:hypothetical protein
MGVEGFLQCASSDKAGPASQRDLSSSGHPGPYPASVDLLDWAAEAPRLVRWRDTFSAEVSYTDCERVVWAVGRRVAGPRGS